jgi:DNA-binding MarR family transcriptional regulator
MNLPSSNAQRLLRLFEQLRGAKASPAFARLHALNISPSHMRAMHMLASVPALPMKDLAEQLGLTPPSVTALTRRLVASGMVQRQAHADDSRVALLSITDAGRALMSDIYHDQLAGMERLLEGLAPDEQQLFLDLLERAVTTLRGDGAPSVAPRGKPES